MSEKSGSHLAEKHLELRELYSDKSSFFSFEFLLPPATQKKQPRREKVSQTKFRGNKARTEENIE